MASVPAVAAASAVILAKRRRAANCSSSSGRGRAASSRDGRSTPTRYGRSAGNHVHLMYHAPLLQRVRLPAAARSSEQLVTEVLSPKDARDSLKVNIPDSDSWNTFVENASGEWDGYGADFNFLGEPTELPSPVVPDAFRDWGLAVHDWQTMCPTLGQAESKEANKKSFGYRSIRLLPTVGCEADAATPYSNDERDLKTALSFTCHENGSYTVVWPGRAVTKTNADPGGVGKVVLRDLERADEWEVEHCLVRAEGKGQKDRVRILQQFRVDEELQQPKLRNMSVYFERWDGPFRNGDSLGGCSTSGSGFATTPTLEPRKLAGFWEVERFSSVGGDEGDASSPKVLVAAETLKLPYRVEPSGDGLVTLPRNLWSSVTASEDGASWTVEAGWLVNPNERIVSSLKFMTSGGFKEECLRFEQRRD